MNERAVTNAAATAAKTISQPATQSDQVFCTFGRPRRPIDITPTERHVSPAIADTVSVRGPTRPDRTAKSPIRGSVAAAVRRNPRTTAHTPGRPYLPLFLVALSSALGTLQGRLFLVVRNSAAPPDWLKRRAVQPDRYPARYEGSPVLGAMGRLGTSRASG